jgi:ATP-dependent DNA ligase
MGEEKFNGWRAPSFPGIDGITRLWTRNGHPIEGVGHILHRLSLMERVAGEPMVFDGEFQVGGTLAATKHWCETGWKQGGEAGVLHLFDCLPLASWRRGEDPTPLYERKNRLKALWDAVEHDPALTWEWRPGSRGRDEAGPIPVQVIEDSWIATPVEAVQAVTAIWARDGEGLMLKDAESPYRRKRTDAWLRVKQENMAKWAHVIDEGRIAA